MSQIFAFGENVQGYNTPVLNEREIPNCSLMAGRSKYSGKLKVMTVSQ